MQPTSRSRAGNLVSLFAVCAVAAACSAEGTKGARPGAGGNAGQADDSGGNAGTTGSGGATGSGGTGTTVIVDDDGVDQSAAPWIPSDLPPPFQYYDDGSERAYKDPALGAEVRDLFAGASTTEGAPAIVYPLDLATHALNLGQITFQWSRGAEDNELFRIDAVGPDGKASRFYVPCDEVEPGQCSYAMPESDWLWLAAGYAGSAVDLSMAGTDAAGGPVRSSAIVRATFSPEPVYGALYYWATKSESLKRATFGTDQAVPYITPESETNDFKCVACHSVSRNGKVIAFAVSNLRGESVAAIQSAPTDDPANPYVRPALGTTPFSAGLANVDAGGAIEQQPIDHFGHNVALNPEGTIAVVNGIPSPEEDPAGEIGDGWPPYVELRDVQDGSTIERYYLGDPVFDGDDQTLPILPEWSPDGSSIVVALANSAPESMCLWSYVTCNSPIAVIPILDGAAFGAPEIVATSSDPEEYSYYPTWSPDGEWIVFQSARRVRDDSNAVAQPRSLKNPNGVIRMVRSSGGPYVCPGPDCIELTNGTQYAPAEAWTGAGKQSTWPKFTPFSQGPNGEVMFVSFTSYIDYGFLARNRSQLWMFAVDTSKVSSGEDPSSAPVWLPYQDPNDGALTPYWTETLPCNVDSNGACTGCVAGEECTLLSGNVCECRSAVVR